MGLGRGPHYGQANGKVCLCVCVCPTKPASHRWGTVTYSTPEKGMSSMWPTEPETRPDQTRPDQTKASIGIDNAPCVSARICFSILCRSFSAVSLLYLCMCVCAPRPPVTWRFYFRSICGHKYSVKCHLVVACVVEFEMK